MNGYQLSKQYFAFAMANPGLTTPGMCALYLWLIEVNNRSRFTQNFYFNTEDAGYACGMQSRKTVWKHLNQLAGLGLVSIVYKSLNQEKATVLSLQNVALGQEAGDAEQRVSAFENTGTSAAPGPALLARPAPPEAQQQPPCGPAFWQDEEGGIVTEQAQAGVGTYAPEAAPQPEPLAPHRQTPACLHRRNPSPVSVGSNPATGTARGKKLLPEKAKFTPARWQPGNNAAPPAARSYKGLNTKNNKNKVNGAPARSEVLQEPALTEVSAFFEQHGYTAQSAERAWAHYRQANWHDVQGRPVLNWQQKCRTVWFTPENKVPTLQTRFVQ